jgi:hypothetical protein
MEPEGSILNPQELSTCSYPEPDQSSPLHPHPTSTRSILILSNHLRLGLARGLFLYDFPWFSLRLTLWSCALLVRSQVVRTLDNFPVFYGTRRFNIEFTRALHLSLSWARLIPPISPHLTSPRSILILSTHLRLCLPSGLFHSGFPTNNLYAFLFSPIRATSHSPRLHCSNYTWGKVKIKKLLVMQFSPFSCHLVSPRPKYPPGIKFKYLVI